MDKPTAPDTHAHARGRAADQRSAERSAPHKHQHQLHSASDSTRRQQHVCGNAFAQASVTSGQLTPPLTPDSPQHDTTFHPYVRAIHAFEPTSAGFSPDGETSTTLPLRRGELLLVHSVHPSGWADSTLLSSGTRGWLPMNYCEAYDHHFISDVLGALTEVWDLIRASRHGDLGVLMRQDYVKAMIAGVRIFLQHLGCLDRDSALLKQHPIIERTRNGLLGDMAQLVKSAKALQRRAKDCSVFERLTDSLDDVVYRAFAVVTRAVYLLDTWLRDVENEEESDEATSDEPLSLSSTEALLAIARPSKAPKPTGARSKLRIDTGSKDSTREPAKAEARPSYRRATSTSTTPVQVKSSAKASLPPPVKHGSKRQSISHRPSPKTAVYSRNLASSRLRNAHDAFIGYIASFVGLHLHSRSTSDLLWTTRQSVDACQRLLHVVEEVWDRGSGQPASLMQARDLLYARMSDFVDVIKILFKALDSPNLMGARVPEQDRLVASATTCIQAAGECVTKTIGAIDKLGDFELEESLGLGLGLDHAQDPPPKSAVLTPHNNTSEGHGEETSPSQYLLKPAACLAPAATQNSEVKSLPKTLTAFSTTNPKPSKGASLNEKSIAPTSSLPPRVSSRTPSQATAIATASLQSVVEQQSPLLINPAQKESEKQRADSGEVSLAGSSSTLFSSFRDSAASASTRVMTPDCSPVSHNETSTLHSSFASTADSFLSCCTEDREAVEEQLMEKTYAHELLYNKDGQVSGGSLPALVEKLTVHDSAPDALFVTTFYLTFRLFTSSIELARCLVDRFDYVGESQSVNLPVRLRVYNVFKQWLESHWRWETDGEAIGIVVDFARGKLAASLPTSAIRLLELISKVSESSRRVLVPRSASSLSKAGLSSAHQSLADLNLPPPAISKSQLNSLTKARYGTSTCSVLDFEPPELARQFTLLKSKVFCSIQPEELMAQEWTRKNARTAGNVLAMSKLSTCLTNLVADTVLQLEEPKKRALMIKQWVKIARECMELRNYDSLMAIVCALNSSMVLRLKKTWDLVAEKTNAKLDELKVVVNVSKNYSALRARLRNDVAPCLPFVGMFLTDLTFVDAGNPPRRQLRSASIDDAVSIINFDKYAKTARIITDLQRFQVPYMLTPVPEMQAWMEAQIRRIQDSDSANLGDYYRRSLQLEPKESQTNASANGVDRSASTTSSIGTRDSGKDRFDLFAGLHFPNFAKEKAPAYFI